MYTLGPGGMTRLALTLLLAVVAAVMLPAAAEARDRLTVGIGEQNGAFFQDPRVQTLGFGHVRLIADYDLAAAGYYDAWLNAARARGLEVLVAFNQHSKRPRRLLSVRAYRRVVGGFLRRHPWIRELSAWNEANATYQPTGRRPGRAARYYNALRSLCRTCTILAADVLDRRGVYRWLRVFKHYVRGRPRLWGLHNYVDANRGRRRPARSSTARLTRRLPGRVWLTETGGVVAFRRAKARKFSYHYNEARAARATARVFRLARASRRITRVYIYHWQAPAVFSTWDSGLVTNEGRARPALEVVRREMNHQRWLRYEEPVLELPKFFTEVPAP